MPPLTDSYKRAFCHQCSRPARVCLCDAVTTIDNPIDVTIYRHSSETNKAVGTAVLCQLSLKNIRIIDGDTVMLDDNPQGKRRVLLFPPLADGSSELIPPLTPQQIHRDGFSPPVELIVLDGSWKKARKMYYLSPELYRLPKLRLDVSATEANYTIRKAEKSGQLSTLEAIASALSSIENNRQKYRPLLALQQAMVEQQLKQMTTKVRQRYDK